MAEKLLHAVHGAGVLADRIQALQALRNHLRNNRDTQIKGLVMVLRKKYKVADERESALVLNGRVTICGDVDVLRGETMHHMVINKKNNSHSQLEMSDSARNVFWQGFETGQEYCIRLLLGRYNTDRPMLICG